MTLSASAPSKKENYNAALKWENGSYSSSGYKIISTRELKKRLPIIYNADTSIAKTDKLFKKGDTVLAKIERNSIIFKNIYDGRIYYYHFWGKATAKNVTFDKEWNIIAYHGLLMDVY